MYWLSKTIFATHWRILSTPKCVATPGLRNTDLHIYSIYSIFINNLFKHLLGGGGVCFIPHYPSHPPVCIYGHTYIKIEKLDEPGLNWGPHIAPWKSVPELRWRLPVRPAVRRRTSVGIVSRQSEEEFRFRLNDLQESKGGLGTPSWCNQMGLGSGLNLKIKSGLNLEIKSGLNLEI